MAEPVRCVAPRSVITGWDFSTSGVKCLAFGLDGRVVAEIRLPTDLWKGDPVEEGLCELNVMQLEGQARASVRAIAARLRDKGRLRDWLAGGISATHHTAGRIDEDFVQVRRAICWNDQTLAKYHRIGLRRLGGQKGAAALIGGPWAIRYTLSHLVKDEACLAATDWRRTHRILPHGALAAGYLTGNFDVASVSAAASTGLMDLRSRAWCRGMLGALESSALRRLAWKQLPRIVDHYEPVGPLAEHVALEAGIASQRRPLVFPTSDDQQAGLVGGGAVDDGQLALILGTSAVVNSSGDQAPARGSLDVMALNWGPYLWMRCYMNGAGILNKTFGDAPPFAELERAARACPPLCDGTAGLPFLDAEPSLKLTKPSLNWFKAKPGAPGVQFRACLEAIANLIALGVREHERAGQTIRRVTVSGGIARSDLMCEILATVLGRRLERLKSDEGPALGAAVTALAAMETTLRRTQRIKQPFTVGDAVAAMVKFRKPVDPNPAWAEGYQQGLARFQERLARAKRR